jgi:hypothetical protein
VEDDAVRVDRAPDVDRVGQRRDRLLVEVVLGIREVDQVERVTEDAADARRSLKRSKFSGGWLVGRQVRGLCVNTCTESAPISSARSIAVWIPPDDET